VSHNSRYVQLNAYFDGRRRVRPWLCSLFSGGFSIQIGIKVCIAILNDPMPEA
jgi:hypothetical protein